jgi:phosphoribosylamine--glycine ligase
VRVAVIGGGGREHALVAALARSGRVRSILAVPGNPGIAGLAECVTGIDPGDPEAVAGWAARERVDLVVVGPEAPLVAGVADAVAARGTAVFGPSAEAARLEGSKAFAKAVMAEAGVPTARAERFTDLGAAIEALDRFGPPWVVKADGLAAGKGVTVTTDRGEAEKALVAALVEGVHGAAGRLVLLEEFLDGPEASLFGVTDGKVVVPLAPARDFKRVGAGDTGPNTGGMGAYSPLDDLPGELVDEVTATVLVPTVEAMGRRGTPYAGLLYAGLALTSGGPKVVEFNCRFGDPETQALLPRLRSDLAELLLAASGGELAGVRPVWWDPRACVTVVVASGGYPGAYRKGLPIDGLAAAAAVDGVEVYHAGTAVDVDGRIVTAGGRVLAVSALGDDVGAARVRAYEAARRIRFEGAFCRPDIAAPQ